MVRRSGFEPSPLGSRLPCTSLDCGPSAFPTHIATAAYRKSPGRRVERHPHRKPTNDLWSAPLTAAATES